MTFRVKPVGFQLQSEYEVSKFFNAFIKKYEVYNKYCNTNILALSLIKEIYSKFDIVKI